MICEGLQTGLRVGQDKGVAYLSVLIWPRTALHPSLHFRGKPSHATRSDAASIREQVARDVSVDRGARQTGLQSHSPETPKLVII